MSAFQLYKREIDEMWLLFLFFFSCRQLAESGAHVIMAVRKPKVAQELIQKWQNEWSGMGLPLNIEVTSNDQ